MRNSTILFASAMLLGAVAANAQKAGWHNRVKTSRNGVEASKVMMAQDMDPRTLKRQNRTFKTEAESKYKPLKETVYTTDEDGAWQLDGEYSYKYDAEGRVTEQMQTNGEEVLLTTTEYSADGLTKTIVEQTSADSGKKFVNSSKVVFVYDPIVTDLVVSKTRYEWDELSEQWTAISDSFKRDITRDADGNILSLVISVPYMGSYDATEKYTNTVDPATKQIDTYKYERLSYDDNDKPFWETGEYLTDIKWNKTNGQLVSQYDEWMQWGNELKSATLAYEEDGKTKSFGNISVEYTGDGGYSEVFLYTDEVGRTDTKKTMLDGNGSFSIEEKTLGDLDGDGKLTDDEVNEWWKEVVSYDDHKNLVEDEYYELDEETNALVKTDGEKTDLTYDAEHGGAIKETLTSSYDMDAQEYVPYSKVVVTEFTDITSGVEAVGADGSAKETAVYNMQGMKLNAAAMNLGGMFIVKKDGKTVKVVR